MEKEIKKENRTQLITSIVTVLLVVTALSYLTLLKSQRTLSHPARFYEQNEISPENGIELPVKWGDKVAMMMESGVIDGSKLPYDTSNGNLVINSQNSQAMLNMLWAFGLGNKNPILENGPMMDPRYGRAGNFASTGGWTLARGNAMTHYSMHKFITLTQEQQELVERVAKNIYRPCCDNSTYFPDCNHGMAMLGLLELMASQGATESEMYKTALQVNIFWFPDQYEVVRTFIVSQNIDWNAVDPKKILGVEYSSASGFQNVLSQAQPQEKKNGTSCGI